jgi:hypothetical protein
MVSARLVLKTIVVRDQKGRHGLFLTMLLLGQTTEL